MITTLYNVKIGFTTPVLGTITSSPDVYTKYLAARAPSVRQAEEELSVITAARARVDAMEDSDEDETPVLNPTIFPIEGGRRFLWDYQIQGMLREAGNTLKDALKVKQLRNKVGLTCYVEPRRIFFPLEVNERVTWNQRPLRAETMRGPRVCLACSEQIDPPAELSFKIRMLPNKEVTEKVLKELLGYGEWGRGCGQWRSGNWGRFELLSFARDE